MTGLVKWTLGTIAMVMAYILMVAVSANASAAPYGGIMDQLVM